MKDAMRAKDTLRLGTIRMLTAAIKQREVDDRIELKDSDVLSILNKMIKQRRDAEQQFRAANRLDLAEKEAQETIILSTYLPEQLDQAAITTAIENAIKTSGASSMKDMGKVMAILKPALQGRVDFSEVSKQVKEQLA